MNSRQPRGNPVAQDDTAKAVQQLRDELRSLAGTLKDRAQGDAELKQHAFDQLYEELKSYKNDWQYQAEKPLLLDLLLFYDSLNWFQESLIKKEMSRDVVADSFQYLIDEFLELLYRRDVVPLATNDSFDRTNQKAVQVLDTDDPELDQQVKQVLKRGFQRGERILRAEEVVVHRYREGGKG
ncbi:MAG: nucleotide exchange factor GrpE [Deltaproteobacteria bacterium]|nr:MAG: nucleotide exchange factor GrpE [Deltaproteobacteria bacterium]